MQHGGPDDAGLYINEESHIVLGHRRLSLIDLSEGGHQPMFSKENNLVIVFNGEIYNYLTLQSELKLLGHQFISHSDTEVIIAAYQQWGVDCFEKFNGMFALAIYDLKKNELVLARDHAGIKPLYYSFYKGGFYFASETRAFKQVDPDWPENADWKTYLLCFGHMPEPFTTLDGVLSLPKGTYMKLQLPTLSRSIHTYYQPRFNYSITKEVDAIDAIRTILTGAVKRHLISDAPIGLFLSGGIDSSILTILAKEFVGENLQTLSIDFDEVTFSEKKYQDIIIKQTGAKHQRFTIDQQLFETSISDILLAMDQPSNDGINSYFITKYAHQAGLKAVLSGIGADELLGGYPSFKRAALLSKTKLIPVFLLHLAELFADDKKKKIRFLERKNAWGQYLFNRGFFTPKQIALILGISVPEIQQSINKIALPDLIPPLAIQEQVSYTESNLYMQNQLLRDTDYMSMWHAVEVRVPFLDKEFMQVCHSIHPSLRFNGAPKHLLIKAFKDILPEAIWNRPKQGFAFPFQQWMAETHLQVPNNALSNQFKADLQSGKTHWSRYWCYSLSQMPTKQQAAW
jgi:asparagine synthase (glutamine-hydrolysing)